MARSENRLLTPEELCERWGVNARLLRDWRHKRIFPAVRLFDRRTIRYRLSDVEAVERGEWVLPSSLSDWRGKPARKGGRDAS